MEEEPFDRNAGGSAREEDRLERIALGAIARSDLPTKLVEFLAAPSKGYLEESSLKDGGGAEPLGTIAWGFLLEAAREG